jgi:aminoglycoside phosphotransferase (APT) family kinase protein
MSAEVSRSRAVLADRFAGWFGARNPDWSDLHVTVARPQPGLSSDTLILAVTHAAGSAEYVARLPPVNEALFPDYDLARQHRVQNALAATGIQAAEALALETDESWVGTSFLLMPKVAGHTLTTSPSYLTDGWLAEQTAARQREVFDRFISLLARIHRTEVESSDVGELSGGGPELTGILDYWDRYLDWATADAEGAAIYRRSIEWCRDNLPTAVPSSALLWGDPQLTNLVLSDAGEIAAVLDFEMAGRGPAEVDLAWFLTLHAHAAETAGAQLPGYPGREAVLATYAEALGRPVADLEWYEVIANVRSGAIVLRIGHLMHAAGHSQSWTALVPQPRHLAQLIGA